MRAYVNTHAHTHTLVHTRTHAHMHTYTQAFPQASGDPVSTLWCLQGMSHVPRQS